jgi:hypothetical protein
MPSIPARNRSGEWGVRRGEWDTSGDCFCFLARHILDDPRWLSLPTPHSPLAIAISDQFGLSKEKPRLALRIFVGV